jgi:hypothetical protein
MRWSNELKPSGLRPYSRARLYRRSLELELLEDRNQPAIFIVTSIADAGPGTLRQAILDANANPNGAARDEIHFSIAGEGVQVIRPITNLPTITDPVIIDGYSQLGASPNSLAVGNNAVLRIELNGDQDRDAVPVGLSITAGSSTIKGLSIWSFSTAQWFQQGQDHGMGVLVTGLGGNVIAGNFIGVKADATLDDC